LSAELKRSAAIEKFSEALEDLEKAAGLQPDAAWISACWARALAAAGRTADALERIDRAVALDPKEGWIRAERALILSALGRRDAALSEAREGVRLAPGSARARWAAADAAARAGLWEDALDAVDRGLKLAPAGAALGDGSRPHALRFDALRALGRTVEASAALKKAAAFGERLVWIEAAGEDAVAALGELDAVSRVRPRDAWPWFWRGELELRLGRIEAAETSLTRALALDPGHAWARAWRGWARQMAARTGPALKDIDAALKAARRGAAGSAVRALEGPLRSLRGDLGLGSRDFESAAADYSKAIAASRLGARPFLMRAEAFLGLRKTGEAERDLRAALDADAGLRPAYLLRAGLRSKRGNLEGALSDLRRAKACGAAVDAGGLRGLGSRPPAPGPAPARGLGRVCVDPRIELVGLLKLALEPRPVPDFCRERAPDMAAYVELAQKELIPHVTPELIARFRATARARGNAGFPWLGITQMMMDVSPAPEMKPLTAAWRDGDDLCLLAHMRTFVEKSRFLEFLDAHRDSFAKWTRPLRATVEKENYAKTVSAYVGAEVDAYYDLILSPLLRDVGLRAILRGEDGARGARTVHCALTSSLNLETALAPKPEDLLWTGWHEMLHLFLDPWCDFYAPEAEEFRGLYASVPPEVRRKNWMDCFSEHHVRAATQRILLLRRGGPACDALAAVDRLEGYRFQDALADKLAEYEGARDKYPVLFDFLPEWLKTWRTLS
jgi:tetratricopeptide (TPR) repeat protein